MNDGVFAFNFIAHFIEYCTLSIVYCCSDVSFATKMRVLNILRFNFLATTAKHLGKILPQNYLQKCLLAYSC